MSDEMDLGFDTLIRRTLHSAELPAAPASLHRALDDLPRTAVAPGPASRHRLTVGLLAAGIVVIAVVSLNGLLGQPATGPGPGANQTPSPTPRPTATPFSSTYPAYSVETLLSGRADGTIGDDPAIVYGWYTDLRDVIADPCPTPDSSDVGSRCLDLRQGLVDGEGTVGMIVDGHWSQNSSPALHPVWPDRLRDDPRAARFFAITGHEQRDRQPIFVLMTGHFAGDAFVVDEILQFDDPYLAATPAPSATPTGPPGSLPPPPARMTSCTEPRAPEAAASGDPIPRRLSSEGWVAKEDVPFPFLGAPVAEAMVYFGIVEGDIPLGIWIDDPDGQGRFRWWGTATCVADANGIFFGWLPGSTYRIFDDGHRVDGGDPLTP